MVPCNDRLNVSLIYFDLRRQNLGMQVVRVKAYIHDPQLQYSSSALHSHNHGWNDWILKDDDGPFKSIVARWCTRDSFKKAQELPWNLVPRTYVHKWYKVTANTWRWGCGQLAVVMVPEERPRGLINLTSGAPVISSQTVIWAAMVISDRRYWAHLLD